MAEISMGDLPNGAGDIEEQRQVGDHVPVHGDAGFHILPTIHPED